MRDDIYHRLCNDPLFKAMAEGFAQALESNAMTRQDVLDALSAAEEIVDDVRRADSDHAS